MKTKIIIETKPKQKEHVVYRVDDWPGGQSHKSKLKGFYELKRAKRYAVILRERVKANALKPPEAQRNSERAKELFG